MSYATGDLVYRPPAPRGPRLSARTPRVATPDLSRIDAFIPRGSPLAQAGGAAMLYRAAASVGRGDPYVGAAVMAALARKESSFGAAAFTPNNFWGWGIHAGPSVSHGPNPEVIAKRVWAGLTDPGGYYKSAKTIGEAINVYAPPGENNTNLYQSQVNSWLPSMGVDPRANFRGAGGGAPRTAQSASLTRSFSAPGATIRTKTWEPVPLSPEAQGRINDYLLTSRLAVSDPKAGLPDIMPLYNFIEAQPRWRQVAGPTLQQRRLPQTLAQPAAPGNFEGTYGFATGSVDSGKVFAGGQGGNWAGSMPRALALAQAVGATPSSQKRSRKLTASGGISDHWIGSTQSYATDLPTSGAAGDRLFRKVMGYLAQLSGNQSIAGTKSGSWHNFNIGGYRYQVGWRVPGHYDHVHVGVERQG